jgi:hypothetical protein
MNWTKLATNRNYQTIFFGQKKTIKQLLLHIQKTKMFIIYNTGTFMYTKLKNLAEIHISDSPSFPKKNRKKIIFQNNKKKTRSLTIYNTIS